MEAAIRWELPPVTTPQSAPSDPGSTESATRRGSSAFSGKGLRRTIPSGTVSPGNELAGASMETSDPASGGVQVFPFQNEHLRRRTRGEQHAVSLHGSNVRLLPIKSTV